MQWKLQEEKSLMEIYKMARDGILNGQWDKAKALWRVSLDIDHDWDASKMRLQNMLYWDTKDKGLSKVAKQTKQLVEEYLQEREN